MLTLLQCLLLFRCECFYTYCNCKSKYSTSIMPVQSHQHLLPSPVDPALPKLPISYLQRTLNYLFLYNILCRDNYSPARPLNNDVIIMSLLRHKMINSPDKVKLYTIFPQPQEYLPHQTSGTIKRQKSVIKAF